MTDKPSISRSGYSESLDFDHSYETFPQTVVDPSVQRVAWVFLRNILRADSMLKFPAIVLDENRPRKKTGEATGGGSLSSFEDDMKEIERIADEGQVIAREGAEAVLGGAILAAWTAFETMAGDLWEAALNAHPHELAALRGRLSKGPKPSQVSDSSGPKPQEEKGLPFSYLERHGYDLRKTMGTVLRERYAFTKLGEIRKAYLSAFGQDAPKVNDPLSSEGITALSAVRNLLVHKAGVIDSDFLEQTHGVSRFAGAREGELLPIDGLLVSFLVGGGVTSSLALLSAVDKWLESHK